MSYDVAVPVDDVVAVADASCFGAFVQCSAVQSLVTFSYDELIRRRGSWGKERQTMTTRTEEILFRGRDESQRDSLKKTPGENA